MTWDLFNITPQRARETMRKLGLVTPEERAKQQAAERQPSAYVPTPDDVKRARAEALARRLANTNERKAARS